METPLVDRGQVDRRWYPTADPAEWARTTRDTVFEAVKQCVAQAIAAGARDDAHGDEVHASDDTFRALHSCADAYARGLYALGQPETGAVRLILVAAREAAEPGDLHPAIAKAIEQWCREAHDSVVERTPATPE